MSESNDRIPLLIVLTLIVILAAGVAWATCHQRQASSFLIQITTTQ